MRNEGGVGAAEQLAERHFVFAPGGIGRPNHVWQYFLSLFAFIIGGVMIQFGAGLVIGALSVYNAALRDALRSLAQGDMMKVPWDLFFGVAIVSFGTYILSLALALAIFHGRSLLTVLTDRMRLDWLRMARAALLYAVLLTAPFFLFLATTHTHLAIHFDPASFAKLVLISAVALIIQTSAEEMVFRGYLVQFMGSFTNSLFVIVGVPSVLFALAHIGNPELTADPGVFGFYLGFGVLMSLTAIRDRGLELTIGAHFANNLLTAILVRSPDSVFQTPTLYILPEHTTGDAPILGPTFAPWFFFILTALFMRRPESR